MEKRKRPGFCSGGQGRQTVELLAVGHPDRRLIVRAISPGRVRAIAQADTWGIFV
jgi:hypothetical protein